MLRVAAAKALCKIGQPDRQIIDALAAALKYPDEDVQKAAVGSLVNLGAPAGKALLAARTAGHGKEIRALAVVGLGKLGVEYAQVLREALNDEDD